MDDNAFPQMKHFLHLNLLLLLRCMHNVYQLSMHIANGFQDFCIGSLDNMNIHCALTWDSHGLTDWRSVLSMILAHKLKCRKRRRKKHFTSIGVHFWGGFWCQMNLFVVFSWSSKLKTILFYFLSFLNTIRWNKSIFITISQLNTDKSCSIVQQI